MFPRYSLAAGGLRASLQIDSARLSGCVKIPKRVQGKWDLNLGFWTVDELCQQTSLGQGGVLGDCGQPCTVKQLEH